MDCIYLKIDCICRYFIQVFISPKAFFPQKDSTISLTYRRDIPGTQSNIRDGAFFAKIVDSFCPKI